MKLITYMIKNNYRAPVAWGDIDGSNITIYAKTVSGWSDRVNFYLKITGEKPTKIGDLDGQRDCGQVQEYLNEIIDMDFISKVAPEFSLEDHVSKL